MNFCHQKLVGDGSPLSLASRLVTSDVFQSATPKAALVNATLDAIAQGFITELFQVTPVFFKGATPGKTSVTPAWYESIWHVSRLRLFAVLQLRRVVTGRDCELLEL